MAIILKIQTSKGYLEIEKGIASYWQEGSLCSFQGDLDKLEKYHADVVQELLKAGFISRKAT